MQVLKSWKTRRLLDADILDQVTTELEERKARCALSSPLYRLHRNHRARADPVARPSPARRLHSGSSDSSPFANFSRNDILRRIEDDRERVRPAPHFSPAPLRTLTLSHPQHKRLKERRWVLPVPSTLFSTPLTASLPSVAGLASQKPSPMSPASPFDPSSRRPPSAAGERPAQVQAQRGPELALEIEFEQLWETGEEERRAAQGDEDDKEVEEEAAAEEDEELVSGKRRRPWALDEQDREEMRTERRRCFVLDDEDGAA